MSGNHPVFGNFNIEFSNVCEGVDAGVTGNEMVVLPEIFRKSDFVRDIGHCDVVVSGGDCVELIPWDRWLAASREQLMFGAGIGPQWEPGGGGGLCT